MARNGKIARLPRDIREQLNIRLDNAEETASILHWLNLLPEAIDLVNDRYNGNPINEHNLSEWRTGGFRDWQAADDIWADANRVGEGEGIADLSAYARTRVQKCIDVMAVHYAAFMTSWHGETTPEALAQMKVYANLNHEFHRLQRSVGRPEGAGVVTKKSRSTPPNPLAMAMRLANVGAVDLTPSSPDDSVKLRPELRVEQWVEPRVEPRVEPVETPAETRVEPRPEPVERATSTASKDSAEESKMTPSSLLK